MRQNASAWKEAKEQKQPVLAIIVQSGLNGVSIDALMATGRPNIPHTVSLLLDDGTIRQQEHKHTIPAGLVVMRYHATGRNNDNTPAARTKRKCDEGGRRHGECAHEWVQSDHPLIDRCQKCGEERA